MQRTTILIVLPTIIAVAGLAGWAQTDAQEDYRAGKTAYEAGRFGEARDLFAGASQTDTRNPEVFLWLGKAHYQLGELEAAIKAWRRTLALAPEEPYAKKMLEILGGQTTDIETTTGLIEVMISERLFDSALRQCDTLRANKALTRKQRSEVMVLRAKALLGKGQARQAQVTVHELLAKYPDQAKDAVTDLLLGQAKMQIGDESLVDGLALLKKVATEHSGTIEAATAEYELIAFELSQSPSVEKAVALAEWIEGNAEHARSAEAREGLVEGYLVVAVWAGPPRPEAGLSDADQAALAAAGELYKTMVRSDEALKLTQRLIKHLDSRYMANKAFGAGIAGVETLIKKPLPVSSRSFALQTLARYQTELALEELNKKARAGALKAGPLPRLLTDVLATYEIINREFPLQAAWAEQEALAGRVLELSSIVPWPAEVKALKVPQD